MSQSKPPRQPKVRSSDGAGSASALHKQMFRSRPGASLMVAEASIEEEDDAASFEDEEEDEGGTNTNSSSSSRSSSSNEGGNGRGKTDSEALSLPSTSFKRQRVDYSAASWEEYFDAQQDVEVDEENTFRVYTAGSIYGDSPVFVLLHGGGHSSLSWALVAGMVKKEYGVVAYDLRGHGDSVNAEEEDLSSERLVEDTLNVMEALYSNMDMPPIILVGHSMGGAIATHVANSGRVDWLAGLVVLDVVEGTALAALSSMESVLAKRPSKFKSQEKAIEWALRSKMLTNLESAKVSMPPRLRAVQRDDGGTEWHWRTALEKSQPHWKGWYENMSELFLGAPGLKMLMVAGTDRLDRALTVAQMQGKFQFKVVYNSGHCLQEDDPLVTADALINFATRNFVARPSFVL